MPRSLHLLNFFYLGSNLITNNVNAISLPRTTQGNAILGIRNGRAMHPSAPPRGGIALPFRMPWMALPSVVLGRLTAFYQCVPSQNHGVHIVSN